MQLLEKLDWLDPLEIAANIPETEESWVLLYSSFKAPHTGRYSFLAFNKQEEVIGSFSEFEKKLSSHKGKYENAWFGYLGYGLKNELEKLKSDSPSYINSPDLLFTRFGIILVFDHEERSVEVWGAFPFTKYNTIEDCGTCFHEGGNPVGILQLINRISVFAGKLSSNSPSQYSHSKANEVATHNLSSNMTRAEYLQKVSAIKEAILCGDIYQANLTRKFFGEIKGKTQPFNIFKDLCSISPAPYSAFMKLGDLNIISSSPERFIHIDAEGNANTRPIKGSIARHADNIKDDQAKATLALSEKDRAENLMIVDLSRNDLARNCIAGSIKVNELFTIETYATVHHMVSSVNGKKNRDASTLDLIKGCFPPGSMTGTPKIKAMEICSDLEKLKRGIYAGAIGWFGGDGSSDLSVVIRTIIMEGNKFEFQVGGAIVSDSVPGDEFTETMVKAKGVATALGIDIRELEKL